MIALSATTAPLPPDGDAAPTRPPVVGGEQPFVDALLLAAALPALPAGAATDLDTDTDIASDSGNADGSQPAAAAVLLPPPPALQALAAPLLAPLRAALDGGTAAPAPPARPSPLPALPGEAAAITTITPPLPPLSALPRATLAATEFAPPAAGVPAEPPPPAAANPGSVASAWPGAAPPGNASQALPEWGAVRLPATQPQQWGQQLQAALGERLQWQSSHGIDRALIRLDPPQLGTLQIAIQHEGGALAVQLTASHGEVLRQLQGISDGLRQELGSRHYGQVAVEVRDGRAGEQAAGHGGQGGHGGHGRQPGADKPGRALHAAADEPDFAPGGRT